MGLGRSGARIVILDRDGVINHDSDDYVKSAAEWQAIDGSIDAIARLSRAGFRIGIATNQSGIARGLYDRGALAGMHRKLRRLVTAAGGRVDRIACCPHGPDDGCDCRKPAPGLLLRLARHFDVGLDGVPFVGDSRRDLDAALAAGASPVLVRTGNGRLAERELGDDSIPVFDDLAAAATAIIAAGGGPAP